MCQSSADVCSCFRVKRKSREAFHIVVSTKYVLFYISLWGEGKPAAWQAPLTLVRHPYNKRWNSADLFVTSLNVRCKNLCNIVEHPGCNVIDMDMKLKDRYK